ncbi:MAG: radical SAM protein, partial [Thermoplasmatales archaeon]
MKDSTANKDARKTLTLPPYLISYAVTRKCNLKCKHCYSDATEEQASDELLTEEAKRLLDEVANWGIKLLIFDGGEPLCRNDFLDIAKYAAQKGLRVVIGSNGTLIDADAANQLKTSGVMAVQISIDGAEAQTHDLFRGEVGAFDKALEGAKSCRKSGLPFQFGMTIRRSTLDEIP